MFRYNTANIDHLYSELDCIKDSEEIKISWMQDLKKIHDKFLIEQQESEDTDIISFSGNIDTHIGPESTFPIKFKQGLTNLLREIYLVLTNANCTANLKDYILTALSEGIDRCTPGYYDRIILLKNNLSRPNSINDLVALCREDIVDKLARSKSSDVHVQRQFFKVANKLSLGVRYNEYDDPHASLLSEDEVSIILTTNFSQKYNFFQTFNFVYNLIISSFHELFPQEELEGTDFGSILDFFKKYIDIPANIDLFDLDYTRSVQIKSECIIYENIKLLLFRKILSSNYFLIDDSFRGRENKIFFILESIILNPVLDNFNQLAHKNNSSFSTVFGGFIEFVNFVDLVDMPPALKDKLILDEYKRIENITTEIILFALNHTSKDLSRLESVFTKSIFNDKVLYNKDELFKIFQFLDHDEILVLCEKILIENNPYMSDDMLKELFYEVLVKAVSVKDQVYIDTFIFFCKNNQYEFIDSQSVCHYKLYSLTLEKMDESTCRLLFDVGFDINATDMFGNTLFSIAAKEGSIDKMLLLINVGADLNIENQVRMSPFIIAYNSGKFKYIVQVLNDNSLESKLHDVIKSLSPNSIHVLFNYLFNNYSVLDNKHLLHKLLEREDDIAIGVFNDTLKNASMYINKRDTYKTLLSNLVREYEKKFLYSKIIKLQGDFLKNKQDFNDIFKILPMFEFTAPPIAPAVSQNDFFGPRGPIWDDYEPAAGVITEGQNEHAAADVAVIRRKGPQKRDRSYSPTEGVRPGIRWMYSSQESPRDLYLGDRTLISNKFDVD